MAEVEAKKQVRPVVKYRVELQKRLEINKSYKERRNRAVALRILSFGLFGQKRFQNLYLSCSLNCFYWALQIATFLHQRVAGLAMVIKFEQVHVIEYYETTAEGGKSFGEKKYTKILIKLTKSPTQEDKKQPGYNPGFKSQDIKDQLKDVIGGKRDDARKEGRGRRGHRRGQNRRYRDNRDNRDGQGERRGRDRQYGGRDRPQRREYRGERREDRPERREDRPERREDRPERREDRPERREERAERSERRERDHQDRRYRGDRQERPQRREKDQYREKGGYQRRQRDELRDRPRREEKERYGDDRDQRRVYKEPQNTQKSNNNERRGEQKTRGGSYHRPENTQNRERRYQPKRQEPKTEKVDRQGRGERKPRANRYSDDSD